MTLTEKLLKEAPGILNWLLDGYRIWAEDGLETPEAVQTATQEYFKEMDPVGSFTAECFEVTNDVSECVSTQEVFELYRIWCKENNEDEKGLTSFGRRLSDLGYKKKKIKGKVYRTLIKLQPEWRQHLRQDSEVDNLF